MTNDLNNKIFRFDTKIWVFIPVYNFAAYLDQCFLSLMNQTFVNYSIIIIDDGSTDGSSIILERWLLLFNKSHEVKLIKNDSNMGPAYTKWQAIEYVRENATINDIFTILDGDDSYKDNLSLQQIFQTYLYKKCLFTYGSALGEYTDQAAPIWSLQGLRRPGSQFKFQHPRSCLVYLLKFFQNADFQDKEGNWLVRLTDWQFIFKCIELSGIEHVAYIKKILYNYRSHPGNVRNKVKNDYKALIAEQIASISPSSPIEEDIHIVMCCYKRHHNLKQIIKSVDTQTITIMRKKKIHFHIINTNPEKWELVVQIRDDFISRGGVFLHICNTNANLYGYARFLYVKKIMKDFFMPYVIFIDDDQYLPEDWVENMYSAREPLSYICWYGRIFNAERGIDRISYWNDKILQHKRLLAEYDGYKQFDYGATCGCIVDTRIFSFDLVFRCPKIYRDVEDLWLSFLIKHVIGTSIKIAAHPINPFTFPDTEQTSLWSQIMQKKEDFLKALCKVGYCFSDSINITELENILEPEDDSEECISKFTYN